MVRLSFGGGSFTEPATLREDVMAQLDGLGRHSGVGVRYDTAPARFRHLLQALHEHAGQRVAVLVDEYDKPILDALVEMPEVARANRDYLRGLYGVIKDSDAHVRFTFLTGVSKFSKVNLFSQLNNLTDLTLDRRYSSICGYTEKDLDTVFTPELAGLDRERVRCCPSPPRRLTHGSRYLADSVGYFRSGFGHLSHTIQRLSRHRGSGANPRSVFGPSAASSRPTMPSADF